jgi:hypothetical protein
MKTNIKVIFYTLKDANFYIASTDENELAIPGLDLTKLDPAKTIVGIQHILKKIHVEYTELSFDWSIYKFVDVELFNNSSLELELNIYYSVFIPPNITIQKTYWINIEKLLPQYSIFRKLLCLI